MSLNKNLNKYSIRCSSENKLVYCWDEKFPQVCPNNTNHLIDLNSIKIIDTVVQNSVNIIQITGDTGSNYRAESRLMIIPPNSVVYDDYTWDYNIAIMTINWNADTSHIGDVIDGYIAPNTTIGAITSNITSGDTLIYVSPTVVEYVNIGYEINITNGVTNIMMGEVKQIDKVNNTLLMTIAASETIAAPAYVQMTIHNINHIYLTPGSVHLATKHIFANFLPKDTVARLKYTNNGNVEKRFVILYEYTH